MEYYPTNCDHYIIDVDNNERFCLQCVHMTCYFHTNFSYVCSY